MRLGAHDLSVSESATEDYRVRKVMIHPEYSEEGEVPVHDIALLALHTQGRRRLRGEVSPVCLPAPGLQVAAGSRVKVAGWGATQEGGVTADRLQEVELELGQQAHCDLTYSSLTGANLGPGVLCAGHHQGGRDACQGDSGGGLLVQSQASQTWLQLGIVSAGIGCARRDLPGQAERIF